ncbi:MAG: nucleotide disphospho-sugar-binding domain-containing protein, partial [Candidatus Limnocylindrales bacterium]
MRIAFATHPALGHLLPLVPLAQAARDAGHDVRVIGGASLVDATRDAGLPHVVSGPPDLPSVFARVAERQGLTGRRLAAATWKGAFAGILAEAMAAGTLELAETWRPDLVVHEDSEQGSWIAAER